MDTFDARVLSAVLLLVLTFAVGFLPPYVFECLRRKAKTKRLQRKRQQTTGHVLPVSVAHTGSASDPDNHSTSVGFGDTLSNTSTEHVIRYRSRSASICSTSSIASRAGLNSTKLLQAFMFFGGGVLLATCFCHLIPEARENFNSYMRKHGGPLESAAHVHTAINDGHIAIGIHNHSSVRPHAITSKPEHHPQDHDDHDHDHDHGHSPDSDSIITTTLNPSSTAIQSEPLTTETNQFFNGHSSHHHKQAVHTPDDLQPSASEHQSHSHGGHHDGSHGKHGHAHSPPYIEMAICGGFFLIYLLEEIVHGFVGHHEHSADQSKKTPMLISQTNVIPTAKLTTGGEKVEILCTSDNGLNNILPTPSASPTCSETGDHCKSGCYDNYAIDLQSEPQFSAKHTDTNGVSTGGLSGAHVQATAPFVSGACASPSYQISLPSEPDTLPASVRFLRGFIIIVAFSAHSVFDGITIGVQTSVPQIWTMLAVILLHKLVVAFAVGLQLFEETGSLLFTSIHMFLFSAMSPIGVIVVICAQGADVGQEDSSLTLIMLSAVATGTILYIVFFEILKRDENKPSLSGFVLWLVMTTGFLLMLAVTVFLEH